MNPIVPLQFPPAQLELSRKEGIISVKCLIRRKKLVLTPEEWVRQHIVAYLIQHCSYPQTLIGVEKPIQYNGLTKRWDIVVFDRNFQPFLLIECKAPDVKLGMDTANQVFAYHKEVNCPFICISNGLHTQLWQKNEVNQQLIELAAFPEFPVLE